jgi:transposase
MFPRLGYKKTSLQERGAMIALYYSGITPGVIARDHFNCSVNTVKLWIRRHEESGDVLRKRGSGRKRATTQEEDNNLIAAVRAKPFTTLQEIAGK